ncbi:MAG: hypothetical protein J6X33_03680 [Clostridiales bacterium]|nr:hypothetical protein [Clostridiales bacterium]
MKIKHITTIMVLISLAAAVLPQDAIYAYSVQDHVVITSLDISVTSPLCGTGSDTEIEWYPYLTAGDEYPEKDDAVEVIKTQWLTVEKDDEEDKENKKDKKDKKNKKDKKDKEEKLIPFEGTFAGGEKYKVYISFRLKSGYSYASGLTKKKIGWEDGIENKKIIEFKDNVMTFTCDITCKHDKDPESSVMTAATCITPDKETYYCLGCGQEIEDIGKIDPDAHDWSEWKELTAATTLIEGSRSHICSYCSKEETVRFPRLYTHVYEPETSWLMSSTVAWPSDGSVFDVAKADVRPGTAFVWLDKDLKVYDRNGDLLKDNIEDYVRETSSSLIPAFYIEDAETAAALKSWLKQSGLKDCFVVATPGKRDLVRDVADIVQVRGMLDYSIFEKFSKHDIADISDAVNRSRGRVIIISQKAATRKNIKALQAVCNSVWVKTDGDIKELLTLYTDGVNGVVTENFGKAIDAIGFFNDDAPTLLRTPLIIGHRGDPSNYVENTLESAMGAYSEGADCVENDVHLSRDGQVVIKHDSTLGTLTGQEGVEIKDKTLEEIKAIDFVWDGEFGVTSTNEVNSDNPTYGNLFDGDLYGQSKGYGYKIPTLREYFEEFSDKDVVHFIEIKEYNLKTLKAVNDLINEFDLRDRVFIITFGQKTMKAMYDKYPNYSLGALGVNIKDYSEGYPYMLCDEICEAEGAEAGLERIYDRIDRWNASLNIPNPNKDMVRAGRHRGLTVWPWTYTLPDSAEDLAEDYKFGMNGLTVDQPWFASGYIEEIRSEDITVEDIEDVPKPLAVTKTGETELLGNAELKIIEEAGYPDGFELAIWRYKETMTIDGKDYGYYYLYSNPFTISILHKEQPVSEEEPEDVNDTSPLPGIIGTVSALAAAGAGAVFVIRRKSKKQKGVTR